MPNDENSQTTQQNGNPMVDNNVSANSGNSDDFDFSFDSEFGSSVTDTQNQVVGQGRTGMFLTPDEEAEKEELQNSGQAVPVGHDSVSEEDPALLANNGSYFPNVNINNNVNNVNNDVNVSDNNTEITEDNVGNISFEQDDNPQNEKFDDKIEDLISFDEDSSVDSSTDTDSSSTDSSNNDDSVFGGDLGENSLANQSLDNEENTVQDMENSGATDAADSSEAMENVENTENVESVDLGNNSQGDDWLQQEDKKVEETFGGENSDNQNMQVNESPADVAQNVESLLNNTTSEGENDLGQNGLDVNNNVSNNDISNDTSLPDGLGQQADPEKAENNYVPSEADFSAMSNLLNSSSAGQVDLRNVNTDVSADASTEPENNFSLGGDISALNNSTMSQDQGNGVDVTADNPFDGAVSITQDSVDTVDNISNTVDNMVNTVDNTVNTVDNSTVGMQNVQTDISNEQIPIGINTQETVLDNSNIMGGDMAGNQPVQMDMQTPVVQATANQSIDLNSIGALGGAESSNANNNSGNIENQGIPLDAMIDKEIQDMHIQPQNINQSNNAGTNMDQVQAQNVQVQGQGKRKKQSGFLVLGIVGGIIVLGALGYFVVAKMFPDKFNMKNLFGGNDIAVEYLTGNEPTGDVENNNQVGTSSEDVDNNGQGDQNDGGVVEDNGGSDGNSVEGQESNVEGNDLTQDGEDVDPNSLAGLLLSDDNGSGGNADNVENPENTENTGSVDNGNSVDNTTGATGDDFDPFSQIDDVLTGEPSDSDKLNDYISKGTYYKELGVSQNDKKMERYGDYIALTAQEELSKLEKGEEIDNTIFSKFDEILESLK